MANKKRLKEHKEITTITIGRDNHRKLSILKIETNAKDMDDVITFLTKRLKEKPKVVK